MSETVTTEIRALECAECGHIQNVKLVVFQNSEYANSTKEADIGQECEECGHEFGTEECDE